MNPNRGQRIFYLENKIKRYSEYYSVISKYQILNDWYLYYTGNMNSDNLLFLMTPTKTQLYNNNNSHVNFELPYADYESLIRVVDISNFDLYKDFFIVYAIPWVNVGFGSYPEDIKEELEWVAYETYHAFQPARVLTIDYETAKHISGIDYYLWENNLGKEYKLEDYNASLYMIDITKNVDFNKLYYKFKGEDYLNGRN